MKSRMVRAQVQLTEEQVRRLRSEAAREGVSFSEMVRRCVSNMFDDRRAKRADLYERAARLLGAFPDPEGAADLSSDHDRHLEQEGYR